jgi:hypothetical protein
MTLKLHENGKVSICEKDYCLNLTGSHAKVVVGVVAITAIMIAVAALAKS